jgi:hypothetical protein
MERRPGPKKTSEKIGSGCKGEEKLLLINQHGVEIESPKGGGGVFLLYWSVAS